MTFVARRAFSFLHCVAQTYPTSPIFHERRSRRDLKTQELTSRVGRYARGDEQVTYESFVRNAKVKEILEEYSNGAIRKLSDVHSMVQEATGKKFGRSKFYKLWKKWRLDNDTRRRRKKRNVVKKAEQDEGAGMDCSEDRDMDYDEKAEDDEADGDVIQIAPADKKRPNKWLAID